MVAGGFLGVVLIVALVNLSPCQSSASILLNIRQTLIPCSVKNQVIWPTVRNSATLELIPATSTVRVGNTFSILLQIDATATPVNAVGALVTYSNNVKLIKKDDSVSAFSISFGDPSVQSYVMEGQPNPGVVGLEPITKFTFMAIAPGTATISIASSAKVLANDGNGTLILGSIEPAVVMVKP